MFLADQEEDVLRASFHLVFHLAFALIKSIYIDA